MAKIPFNVPRRDNSVYQAIGNKIFRTAGEDFIIHRGFYSYGEGKQMTKYGYRVSHYRTGLNIPVKVKTGYSPEHYYGFATIPGQDIYDDPRTIAEAEKETIKVFKEKPELKKIMKANIKLARVVNL